MVSVAWASSSWEIEQLTFNLVPFEMRRWQTENPRDRTVLFRVSVLVFNPIICAAAASFGIFFLSLYLSAFVSLALIANTRPSEWKEKFDMVDDEAEDTLTYHYKNTFIFRPELSGAGLTGNEIITMPHPSDESFAIDTTGID